MLKIETCFALIAVVMSAMCPSVGRAWFERFERKIRHLTGHRLLCVVLVGVLALSLRAALLPLLPVPEPIVHDEFAYLLAADTFTHGRLTNPTHPMWEHFQTSGVIQKPTYQCFAQPAQGMILAFGKIVFGHPFWGVWLSVGLMCASIAWMLQGWLPSEWALLGGVLADVRFGVFGYWANSYWGGAAGAIGGALVLGALPRIKQTQHPRDALLMGIGIAILANNRPYEGFVFCLPIAVALIASIVGKQRPLFRRSITQVIAPLVFMLVLTGAGLGYYFWRVTGSPFDMPYQVERQKYGVSPYMVWQGLRADPEYQHNVFRARYIQGEIDAYHTLRSPAGVAMKTFWAWEFYLGPLLTLPLIGMLVTLPRGFSWKDVSPNVRFLLFESVVFAIGLPLEIFYSPHYSSPATGLVLLWVLIATRRLTKWDALGNRRGLFVARSIAIIAFTTFALRALATPLHIPIRDFYIFAWHQKAVNSFGRGAIESQLEQMSGRQLVIVRYDPKHDLFVDWVHNEADIDNSKVVWANELGGTKDEQLIRYFQDRRVFLLEADKKPPTLTEYVAH